jgi:hypothetical protein
MALYKQNIIIIIIIITAIACLLRLEFNLYKNSDKFPMQAHTHTSTVIASA